MTQLDKVDRLLLQRLMDDGRSSFSALARETKLTDVAIKKRFERLKRMSVIKAVTANLDYDALGFSKPVFVMVKSDPGKAKQLTKKLKDLDFVIEFYHLIGESNFMMKLTVPNISDIQKYLHEISVLDGVREMQSMMVLDEHRKLNVLPSAPFQKRIGDRR
jgi:DNA-binding Lrp family transcriptional regulator